MADRATPMRRPAKAQSAEDHTTALDTELGRELLVQLTRIADGVEQIMPAAAKIEDFSMRLDLLCAFARRWARRLWWIIPLVMTFSNSISPELGEALGQIAVRAAQSAAEQQVGVGQ